jgi:hypothetical membrane protein
MKKQTSQLLTAGIIAGPIFVIGSIIHGLIRPGFDMVRHAASLLLVGELGWIQAIIFVLTGLLYIASGIGLRRVLTAGIGSRFVSPLFILFGVAIAAGGIFTPDPSLGFPPGAPSGVPQTMSWHSMLHGVAPVVGFTALVIALIILGRRFGKAGERRVMWVTIIAGILTLVLSMVPNITANWETGEFNFIPLWISAALGMGYASLVLLKLKREGEKEK